MPPGLGQREGLYVAGALPVKANGSGAGFDRSGIQTGCSLLEVL